MKKTILFTLILFAVTLLLADTINQIGSRRAFPGSNASKTEQIAYRENFEDGAPGWYFSPDTDANLWHIATVADAPSPTQAMINQNAQQTYNPNMNNFLYSPPIQLPLSGAIRADFMMKGDFTDLDPPTSSTVIDYWYWDISIFTGGSWSAWYRMSNPYGSPSGINYIFIDAPDSWSSVTASYNGLDGIISDYAGYSVRFRICFKSDGDAPIGTGIMIDDFTIYNDVFLPPPTNLFAETVGQTVELSWQAPPSGYSIESITSTNSAWTSFVSDAEGYAMKIQNPFTYPLQLQGIQFMLYRQNSDPIIGAPTVHVYNDDAGLPGVEVATVSTVTNINNMQWKLVDISSHNIMIPASGHVFVGISNIADGGTSGQGLLCDSTSVSLDSYALFQGNWEPLNTAYAGLHNAALAGVYWVDDPFAPVLTGFKVYHALNQAGPFNLLETITLPGTVEYVHASPTIGQVNYYAVSALFDIYESEFSNIAAIDLINLLYTELINDDGQSNQNYNIGAANSWAVKFTTQPNAQIHYAKVFVNQVGNSAMIVRVFDANGPGGLPGTQLLQFTAPVTLLSQGWNNVPLPAANIITDPDGVFYIGVYEYASACVFGLDTNSSGNTWTKIGSAGAWTPLTEGNVMLRALVSWGNSNEDLTELTPVANLKSYPNPFSQTTDFSFDLRKTGSAQIKIYNLKGQLVRSITTGTLAQGNHILTWDGNDDSGNKTTPGIYFYRLQTDGTALTRKVVRIR